MEKNALRELAFEISKNALNQMSPRNNNNDSGIGPLKGKSKFLSSQMNGKEGLNRGSNMLGKKLGNQESASHTMTYFNKGGNGVAATSIN